MLEEPSRGFFGIGSKLAKVRVEEKEAEKPVVKPEKVVKHEDGNEVVIEVCGVNEAPERPARPARSDRQRSGRGRRGGRGRSSDNKTREFKGSAADNFVFGEAKIFGERPEGLTETTDHPAAEFLNKIRKEMGLDINIKVAANEDSVFVDIDGPDSGTIIGKRGQTLDSLQYLTSLVVNRSGEGYIRVKLDTENYRERRRETLESLAKNIAYKVKRTKKSVSLEPMNPYERRIIHSVLQSDNFVMTRSEGEEPYRHVVVFYKRNRNGEER